jgi:hypothetical protein
VLNTLAVHDGEVIVSKDGSPTSVLPGEVLVADQPLQGLMICDNGDVPTMNVMPENLACPNHS